MIPNGVSGHNITETDVLSHSTEIFSPVSKELSMIKGQTVTLRPISEAEDGTIEFNIFPPGNTYTQLASTRLYLQLKVVKQNGANITIADNVAYVNNIGSSLFKTIEIAVNGQLKPDLTNTDAHIKSYVETLLTYGYSAQISHLKSNGWNKDKRGKYNIFTLVKANDIEPNPSYVERRNKCTGSKSFEVMFTPASDFLQSDRLLPPKTNIQLRFHREDPKFYMLSDSDAQLYKIKIEKAELQVRYIALNDRLAQTHKEAFQKMPAALPFTKSEIKKYQFAGGMNSISYQHVITGDIPKSMILFMSTSDASNGDQKSNPFKFEHFNATRVSLNVNGEYLPSAGGYMLDFDNNIYLKAYKGLFDNVGIAAANAGLNISPEDFASDCCFFAFDLTPDLCNGFHCHLKQSGTVNFSIDFKEALAKPITVYALSSYDKVSYINQLNDLIVD